MKIQSIHFKDYIPFTEYSITFTDYNILVGPNNSGKSKIIQSIQLLNSAWKRVKRTSPTYQPEIEKVGYRIPEASLPCRIDNIHNEYRTVFSSVRVKFENTGYAVLTFSPDLSCYLHFENSNRDNLETIAAIKTKFKFDIGVIPFVGPIEPSEKLLSESHVRASIGTHLSPRHFRNQWHYFSDNFSMLQELLNRSWPEMGITEPERQNLDELVMFCSENGITREMCWGGVGFQVWMQILSHLVRNKTATTIIFDEPEIFLYPDLQRKFVTLSKEIGPQIIIATHSVEIINEAEISNIIIIDKKKRSAEHLEDARSIQKVIDILGSIQNMHLTRLIRNKKVLFLEGNDFQILKRYARKLGFNDLANEDGITIVPIGGFNKWPMVTHADSLFGAILEENISSVIVLDKDYRCTEELDEIKHKIQPNVRDIHIWERKEIENYLLNLDVIKRLARYKLDRRSRHDLIANLDDVVEAIFRDISAQFIEDIVAQYQESKCKYRGNRAISTINRECSEEIRTKMRNHSELIKLVPGKAFLMKMNSELQRSLGVSLTNNELIRSTAADEIDDEIIDVITKIEHFRNN